MKKITFIIDGKPRGKERPRVTKRGITYTPRQTREYEKKIQEAYMEQVGKRLVFSEDEYLEMILEVYCPIAKSKKESEKKDMADGIIRPVVKPDLDNILKAVADAGNGLIYKDDVQITDCTIRKYYSLTPRVEVTIRSV